MMSLVDYASSDDDEVSDGENKENEPAQLPMAVDNPQPPSRPQTQSVVSSYQRPESTAHISAPAVQKLPDASQLFDSPDFSPDMLSGYNHFSSVASANSESTSRKRESNSFASSVPRSKVPRGDLPNMRHVPDTIGGLLVPPQLSGRSNVVTEDVKKLFVQRSAGGSPQ